MKADEAPEKIWIDNLDEGFWFDSPSGNKSIEYIRKDAFIEKACEYLEPQVMIMLAGDKIDTDKFIEDFKNAMRGGNER